MAYLNADVPRFECLVRREYLYNLEAHHGEVEPVVVFGLASRPGYALGFHVMTSSGALIWRLPISALVTKEDAPNLPLDYLQLWDAMSADVSVHEFAWLSGARVQVLLKDRKWYPGRYRFTVDWTGSPEADNPGDIGHKCAHLIELDCGCFALQPNNRILWSSPSFVSRPFAERPDYKTNTHVWRCETGRRGGTEESDRMFSDTTAAECPSSYSSPSAPSPEASRPEGFTSAAPSIGSAGPRSWNSASETCSEPSSICAARATKRRHATRSGRPSSWTTSTTPGSPRSGRPRAGHTMSWSGWWSQTEACS